MDKLNKKTADQANAAFGCQFFREGDMVVIVNNAPPRPMIDRLKDEIERQALSMDEYQCPFDFMTEFDRWFRWKEREYFRRHRTGEIMVSMVESVERIKANKVDRPSRVRFNDFNLSHGLFTPEQNRRLVFGAT